MLKKLLIIYMLAGSAYSCSSVKEYEKQQVNDPEMVLSPKPAERYETNFQVYREGASGANGGKTGGGCGCN